MAKKTMSPFSHSRRIDGRSLGAHYSASYIAVSGGAVNKDAVGATKTINMMNRRERWMLAKLRRQPVCANL
jgi:hypothetical protein